MNIYLYEENLGFWKRRPGERQRAAAREPEEEEYGMIHPCEEVRDYDSSRDSRIEDSSD